MRNWSEIVDRLLAAGLTEDDIRLLCRTTLGGWIDLAGPMIDRELERRRRARLPWWRRIFA